MNPTLERFAPLILLVATLLLWQFICVAFNVSEFIFPSPMRILEQTWEHRGTILGHAWRTFWVTMVGFGIAIVVGVLLGFLMGSSKLAYIATGLATLEPELEDVLRVLGAKRWDVLMKVGLPRSMPYFYGSLKVAITLAFVGTTVSEMTASNEGIGYLLISAGSSMQMGLAFSGLVVVGIMAMAMYELFSVIEKRTTAWAHRGSQGH